MWLMDRGSCNLPIPASEAVSPACLKVQFPRESGEDGSAVQSWMHSVGSGAKHVPPACVQRFLNFPLPASQATVDIVGIVGVVGGEHTHKQRSDSNAPFLHMMKACSR